MAKSLIAELLYSQKYWQELNLVVGSQIAIANIGGFKFGSSVLDHHTCNIICKKFWWILIWRLLKLSAKFSGYTVINSMVLVKQYMGY